MHSLTRPTHISSSCAAKGQERMSTSTTARTTATTPPNHHRPGSHEPADQRTSGPTNQSQPANQPASQPTRNSPAHWQPEHAIAVVLAAALALIAYRHAVQSVVKNPSKQLGMLPPHASLATARVRQGLPLGRRGRIMSPLSGAAEQQPRTWGPAGIRPVNMNPLPQPQPRRCDGGYGVQRPRPVLP